jgi:hypothetical protein
VTTAEALPFGRDEVALALERDPGPFTVTSIHEAVPSGTGGLWRVGGDGWSLVRKLVRHSDQGSPNWLTGEAIDHWYYWRREVLAYTSGLTASFSGGLRGPRLCAAVEQDDGSVALWLEDAGSHAGQTWALERYGEAARHLGRAQGAFGTSRPVPEDEWLSRRWLRQYVDRRWAAYGRWLDDDRAWKLARFPPGTEERVGRVVAARHRLLDAVEQAPATVCHFDLHPANLFAVGDETVLIDWSFVGLGVVGEDAGNLVPDAVFDFHVDPGRLPDLRRLVEDGYRQGLREAGWAGDDTGLALGLVVATAVKYFWIVPATLAAFAAGVETLNRRPRDDALRWWRPAIDYVLDLAEEAYALL